MNCPISNEQLAQLKGFISVCQASPQILNHPSLEFFKDFIISCGGHIPAPSFKPTSTSNSGQTKPQTEKAPEPQFTNDESDPESEVELDLEGVIEGDKIDETQEMGDSNKTSTEEETDQSDEKRSAAMKHFSDQEFDESLKMYTEAILLNPSSALLFAKRGQVQLKLNKPNACIKDCTRALELNCDSAAAYKFRGRAHRLLGNFEQAAADLRESCKIDYDEQAQEWLAEVTPNADKIRTHALNKQRRKEDKEHKEKLRRYQEAKAAHSAAANAKKTNDTKDTSEANSFPQFPQGFGDADANAGGQGTPFNMSDPMGFFNDPELMTAFQDPEIAAAFKDASANPANIFKYQNNPKIANILNKLASKVGGSPNFPPGGAATPTDSPFDKQTPPSDDVGLD